MLLSQGSQVFVENFTPKATAQMPSILLHKRGDTLRAHGEIVFQTEFVFLFISNSTTNGVYLLPGLFCHRMQQGGLSPDT